MQKTASEGSGGGISEDNAYGNSALSCVKTNLVRPPPTPPLNQPFPAGDTLSDARGRLVTRPEGPKDMSQPVSTPKAGWPPLVSGARRAIPEDVTSLQMVVK